MGAAIASGGAAVAVAPSGSSEAESGVVTTADPAKRKRKKKKKVNAAASVTVAAAVATPPQASSINQKMVEEWVEQCLTKRSASPGRAGADACTRCGRVGHISVGCDQSHHVNGNPLIPREEWMRNREGGKGASRRGRAQNRGNRGGSNQGNSGRNKSNFRGGNRSPGSDSKPRTDYAAANYAAMPQVPQMPIPAPGFAWTQYSLTPQFNQGGGGGTPGGGGSGGTAIPNPSQNLNG